MVLHLPWHGTCAGMAAQPARTPACKSSLLTPKPSPASQCVIWAGTESTNREHRAQQNDSFREVKCCTETAGASLNNTLLSQCGAVRQRCACVRACVCVRGRARERERESVCVCERDKCEDMLWEGRRDMCVGKRRTMKRERCEWSVGYALSRLHTAPCLDENPFAFAAFSVSISSDLKRFCLQQRQARCSKERVRLGRRGEPE